MIVNSFLAAVSLKLIHLPVKIGSDAAENERKDGPGDPVTFCLIKYATIISMRNQARSRSFRDALERSLFR